MEQRMQELARHNVELRERLTEEGRLRREAEHRVLELLTAPPVTAADSSAEALLRQELSLALEELQVMQEELQAAHNALSAEHSAIS